MEQTDLERLVGILRVLVTVVFACNIAALFFVPLLVVLSPKEVLEATWQDLACLMGWASPSGDDIMRFPVVFVFFLSWVGIWGSAYHAVLACFLWVCGVCTAVILWQARNVLGTMLGGTPFVAENAGYLKSASAACFVISFASALRTVWGFFYYRSLEPLLTYNFLFCPLFFMGGLLFLVMSALFRQAAQLREENDLTI